MVGSSTTSEDLADQKCISLQLELILKDPTTADLQKFPFKNV